MSAGFNHTVATRTDGSLWAWGANGSGQLGDGTTTGRNMPTRIGLDNDWVFVSAGSNSNLNNFGTTLAIRNNGSLWAWGANSTGQLGDGTTAQRNIPVLIQLGTAWTVVSAGGFNNSGSGGISPAHTAGIRADGTFWTWGLNGNGRLGDGTTTQRTSPVEISLDRDW